MAKHNTNVASLALTILFASICAICLTTGIVWAALTISKSIENSSVGQPATLETTINSGSITVNNKMPCVMRATATASGVTFDTTNWTKQVNGWYYYNSVIASGGKTVSVTGATANNVVVELMQANYNTTTNSSSKTIPAGGFIPEWATRDMTGAAASNLSNTYTVDGVSLGGYKYGETASQKFAVYYGTSTVGGKYATTGTYAKFQLTQTSGATYKFDKVRLTSATEDAEFSTITTSNAIKLYNNSTVPMVFSFQFASGTNSSSTSAMEVSGFNSTGWTAYTYESKEHFYSTTVLPGQYVTLTDGTATVVFGEANGGTKDVFLTISAIDSNTFYTTFNPSTAGDPYLAWLNKLGSTYLTQFQNMLSGALDSGTA
ncbi:MAG: hypothetical protein J6C13_04420 [Clostridia bacterium]|nr:hypothetical protein [Clostridia bacterium]